MSHTYDLLSEFDWEILLKWIKWKSDKWWFPTSVLNIHMHTCAHAHTCSHTHTRYAHHIHTHEMKLNEMNRKIVNWLSVRVKGR